MLVSCFIFSHPCHVKFTTLVHDQFVRILRGGYFVRIHISLLYDFVLVTVRFRGGVRPRSFVQIHMNCATLKIRTIKQKLYEFVRVRLYKFVRISHLVKYVRIAVRSGWKNPPQKWLSNWRVTLSAQMFLALWTLISGAASSQSTVKINAICACI